MISGHQLSAGMGRFGDGDSATPIRRHRFGDRRFGDGTIRRRDVSATKKERFGDMEIFILLGRFGDMTFLRE